jgi:pyruvate carboxylase
MALRVVLLLAACDGGSALAASLRGVGRPLAVSRPAPTPAVRMGVEDARMYVNEASDVDPVFEGGSLDPLGGRPPFKKVMAANRAEIAVRIMRAATELNMATVAIYGYEDRYSQHRWGSDQSFQLEKEATASPISAYLDIKQIVQIALDNGVDAVHPGYGAPPLLLGCCRRRLHACTRLWCAATAAWLRRRRLLHGCHC